MPEEQQPADPPEDTDMIHEGSGQGLGPSVRFDPAERQNYHLNHRRERVYHEVPTGFVLDDQGAPIPIADCGLWIAELDERPVVAVADSPSGQPEELALDNPAQDPEAGTGISAFVGLDQPEAPAQEG